MEETAREWEISEPLIEKLQQKGYKEFFSVQKQVIPILLRQNKHYRVLPQDICVSAPTGSGKTLSYALPIVDILLKKKGVRRLRALVLLPNRELAIQVHSVFQELVENTDVKVMLAISSTSFAQEQLGLVGFCEEISRAEWAFRTKPVKPFVPEFGISLVDILIATPGRLLDHIQTTPGFTLEHLRFLVLDEADRLLGNAYHDWVRALISSSGDTYVKESTEEEQEELKRNQESNHHHRFKRQRRNEIQEEVKFQSSQTFHLPLQKLLFSATLTDNPTALALLGITLPINIHCKELYAKDNNHNRKKNNQDDEEDGKEAPLLIADASTQEEDYFQEEIFDLPELLTERVLIVETKNRLLKLLGVLLLSFHSFGDELRSQWDALKKEGMTYDFMHSCAEKNSVCIIFVNSVDASHRLSLFLKVLNNQLDEDDEEEEEGIIPASTRAQLRQLRDEVLDHFHLSQIMKKQEKTNGVSYLFNGRVEEMTRLIKPQEREQIISAALTGEVSIIVCSDRMARGMDLPQLKLVINYDLPKSAKTYIHRAGRTARAGRSGICLSIVKKGQVTELNLIRDQIRRTGRPAVGADVEEAGAEKTQNDEENQPQPQQQGRRKKKGGKQHVLDYFQLCYMSKAYLDALTPFYEQSIQVLPALLSQETGGK